MVNKGDVTLTNNVEVKNTKNIVCGIVIKGILMENEPRTLFCQVYWRDW